MGSMMEFNMSPFWQNLDFYTFSVIAETQRLISLKSKKISNDQELIQSDPISCPQNQKGNN